MYTGVQYSSLIPVTPLYVHRCAVLIINTCHTFICTQVCSTHYQYLSHLHLYTGVQYSSLIPVTPSSVHRCAAVIYCYIGDNVHWLLIHQWILFNPSTIVYRCLHAADKMMMSAAAAEVRSSRQSCVFRSGQVMIVSDSDTPLQRNHSNKCTHNLDPNPRRTFQWSFCDSSLHFISIHQHTVTCCS